MVGHNICVCVCGFYLTDEECKSGNYRDVIRSNVRFYLTDEECKSDRKVVSYKPQSCFYLTDEECKLILKEPSQCLKFVFI